MKKSLSLRPVTPADLPLFFEHQRDEVANHLAAFTRKDPNDRASFMTQWQRILAEPTIITRTITLNEKIVGSVLSYEDEGKPEVSYWLDRAYWGQGIATWGLTEFLTHVNLTRPMYARVAADNLASRRVLEKCGFIIIQESRGFALARGQEIAELLLRLT